MSNQNPMDDEIPAILTEIWDNWRSDCGKGPCAGCDAHWSRREDLPGEPGSRDNSFGIAPYYGVGSLDPHIVVLGREPGTIKSGKLSADKNRLTMSFEERYEPDISTVTKEGRYSLRVLNKLFSGIKKAGLNPYWSQLRKCNEQQGASDDEMEEIQERCCGVNSDSEGYLRRELKALSPDIVITLAEDTFEKMADLYDVTPPQARNYSALTVSGDSPSGMRPVNVPNQTFQLIPAPHPGQGWSHANDALGEKGRDFSSKRDYYAQLAEDVCDLIP